MPICDPDPTSPVTPIQPPAPTFPTGSWWFDRQGKNMLAGIFDSQGLPDSDNPARLSDEIIVDFLWVHPRARSDFNILLPHMLPEEQARLEALIEDHPYLTTGYRDDIKVQTDRFQARQNKAGVQTAGSHGGTGRR